MPRSAEGYEGVVELKMADGWVGGFLQTHKVKPGWHGFQYDLTNGRSPAPFTEKVPTYNLVITNGTVRVNPQANPPGTFVEPLVVNTIDGQATL